MKFFFVILISQSCFANSADDKAWDAAKPQVIKRCETIFLRPGFGGWNLVQVCIQNEKEGFYKVQAEKRFSSEDK
jgi:hypothetical protein